jgi:phage tail-like protein
MSEMAQNTDHTATLVTVDSLVANEFEVELEGETLPGVFRVSGLVTFKLDGDDEHHASRTNSPILLSKMVQRDGNSVFNKWLRETANAKSGEPRPRRTLAVVAIDDGVETRRWTISGAWIQEVRYSDFDSASSAMVEEIVTIQFDSLQEHWSATTDLE